MTARVVKSKTEFEGRIREELALVAGRDLRAWPRSATLASVGRRQPRVDGVARVTGRARYTTDVALPGMLHARFLRSPHPHARVTAVDARRATALPGVRAVLHRFNAPKVATELFAEEVRYVGDEVAAVAAEDEAIAEDALRLIAVTYEVLPFVVDLGDGIQRKENVKREESYARGDVRRGFAEADAVVEATYRTSTQLHNCLEPHGSVAQWDGERLTLWDSTQSVFDVRSELAKALGLPLSDVRVVSEYMGGGFGSKNGLGKYGVIAAVLAQQLGRPVRSVLTREEENLAAGNRSATVQRVKVGATKDGKLTALEHVVWSGTGTETGWVATTTGPSNSLYAVPNVKTEQYVVLTNTGPFSAFRAPGYVEGTFALESALDELADKLGLDALELRRRNDATTDPQSKKPYSLKRLRECYARGAELIDWKRRRAGGSAGRASHLKRGIGMATQVWGGGGGPPAYATVHLNKDGTVVLRAGTQDIGTGSRTVLAQIVAEELAVDVEKVRVVLGDTDQPYAPVSAGSMTLASVGPAARLAAADARRQVLEAAAGLMEVRASEIRLEDGCAIARDAAPGKGSARRRRSILGRRGKKLPVSEIFKKLNNYTVIGRGSRRPNPDDLWLRTFGAHFAEVEVDTRTGAVRVVKVAAVHDIGRVVNPMTARSQVMGGVLQSLGFGLTEERVVDRSSGDVLNANLEDYKVPTARDAPEIVVEFVDRADTRANNLGAKGLGEPPIIPTAAAIANAIANATGARVRTAPMTPARVLEALRK